MLEGFFVAVCFYGRCKSKLFPIWPSDMSMLLLDRLLLCSYDKSKNSDAVKLR